MPQKQIVNLQKIADLLDAIEAGNKYLDAIMPDLNGNPFAFAVEGYLDSINEKLEPLCKDFRERRRRGCGNWDSLAYAEICDAVQPEKEESRQRVEFVRGQRQQSTQRTRPASAPLLLVPMRPEQLPVS
jgi:hypothetical protein